LAKRFDYHGARFYDPVNTVDPSGLIDLPAVVVTAQWTTQQYRSGPGRPEKYLIRPRLGPEKDKPKIQTWRRDQGVKASSSKKLEPFP